MLIDSHCHLNYPDFEDELPQVISRAEEAGICCKVEAAGTAVWQGDAEESQEEEPRGGTGSRKERQH